MEYTPFDVVFRWCATEPQITGDNSLPVERLIGLQIQGSSTITTININTYSKYRQYHWHAGGWWWWVSLLLSTYVQEFNYKQNNRNLWWEMREVGHRRENWFPVLMRVQLYLIFICEDGVYLPLQIQAAINSSSLRVSHDFGHSSGVLMFLWKLLTVMGSSLFFIAKSQNNTLYNRLSDNFRHWGVFRDWEFYFYLSFCKQFWTISSPLPIQTTYNSSSIGHKRPLSCSLQFEASINKH
jgi:hypothetical protein